MALHRCLNSTGVFTDVLSLSLAARFVKGNPAPEVEDLAKLSPEQQNELLGKPYAPQPIAITPATHKMMQEAVRRVIAAGQFGATIWIGELIEALKIEAK